MSGFVHNIQLKVLGRGSVASAITSTSKLDANVNSLGRHSRMAGNEMHRAGKKGTTAFDGIRGSVTRLVAGLGIMAATVGSINAAADLEGINKAITFASAGEGQKNLKFIDQTVEALGLNLLSTQRGMKQFLGGVQGTALENNMQGVRDIFYGVSEAAAVMQLKSDETEGVFLALSQMASKGKVSAEELRGQLGERLPGAFGIAARSMGMTTAELDKALQKGEIYATDFLPKFAKELHSTFGAQVPDAANSARANMNRFNNSLVNLSQVVGTKLLPPVITLMNNFFIPAVNWIGQNIQLIGALSIALGIGTVAYKAYAVSTAISAAGAKTFAGVMKALNLTFLASPIFWITAGILALGAGVIYAWNKFEGFRGFLVGTFEVIKTLGNMLKTLIVDQLVGMGKTIVGIFTLDKDMILGGLKQSFGSYQNAFSDAGKKLGAAYSDGYQKGVDAKKVKAPSFMSPDALSSAFKNTPTGAGTGAGGGLTGGDIASGGESVQRGISGITGGGKNQRNYNINVQKFFDEIVIQSQNVSEGTDQVVDIVMRKFLKMLNSANQMQ